MDFTKPSLTLPQQLDLLIECGVECRDREQTLHYLRHINYYRLAAYWRPFEANPTTHRANPGKAATNYPRSEGATRGADPATWQPTTHGGVSNHEKIPDL